jgi:hypothetical protein
MPENMLPPQSLVDNKNVPNGRFLLWKRMSSVGVVPTRTFKIRQQLIDLFIPSRKILGADGN